MALTQLEQIEHDLKNVRNQMSGLIKGHEETANQLERIVILLRGDDIEKDKGFIPRLIVVEKIIERFERTKSYYVGVIAAIVGFGSVCFTVGMGLVKVYDMVFKK